MSNPTTEALTENAELSVSERYELLGHERRRIALDVLSERADPLSLSELATAVAAREGGAEPGAETEVQVTLHHVHLPMMDDFEAVRYDPEAKQIAPLDVEITRSGS